MKKLYWIVLLLLSAITLSGQERHTISGYVTDMNGETLIGANVIVNELGQGTITNPYGFYSLTLPEGTYTLEFSFIGYAVVSEVIKLNGDQKYNISLTETSQEIEGVEIRAEGRDVNIREVEMSTNTLPMKTIQKLPVLFGETDVIKTIQLLPGVLAANEAAGGFHVRGGSVDQNLVLLDHAPVYNASHAVGFLSVFNADAIKDLKLYKGGMPAEYGGRLSSILDIHMKEGNKNTLRGTGGVGTITSRLTVEGPILKNRASFLVAGRRTYADLFLPFSSDSLARESDIFFYDLNAKVNYAINENNRLFLSGYFGRDVVKFGDLLGIDYGNATGTIRWNHIFNNRLFMNTTSIFSNYRYEMGLTQDLTDVTWVTYITDWNQRVDFSYYINPGNTLEFGAQMIYHTFKPGDVSGQLDEDLPVRYSIPAAHSLEYGLYVSNELDISSKLGLLYGLRYSFFQNIGPGQSLEFDKSDPQEYVVTDTIPYASGKVFNSFPMGWEPRLSLRYTLDSKSSVKASYNRMYQYVHLASNSTASLPLDFWFVSSPNIKPQMADQVAAGYFRNFKDNIIEASLEVFYKWNKNAIDFRDHANLLLNDAYEGEIRAGKAWSYGVEFLVRKQQGKLTGWLSYTYSRTFKQIDAINDGDSYPASYDKPHDFALVLSYDISERVSLSGNWVYTSAPPRTMPTSRFEFGGTIAPAYSDRNSVRVFPYHRLDLAVNIRLNKQKQRFEHFLNISVYNAYMRKNPIQISFRQDPDIDTETNAYITYLYQIVPSITYNFNF